ncbi:hypothetical protein U1Q18_040544 [Sarracenia purpurea var. burkii]
MPISTVQEVGNCSVNICPKGISDLGHKKDKASGGKLRVRKEQSNVGGDLGGKEELSPTKETPASVEQGSEIRAPVVFEARSGKGRESYRAETKGEAGEDAVKEKTPVSDGKVEAEQGNTPVPDDKKGEILIFGEDAEREDSGTDEDLEMGVVQVVSEEEEDENEVADGECGAKVEQGDIILSSPLLQSQDPGLYTAQSHVQADFYLHTQLAEA